MKFIALKDLIIALLSGILSLYFSPYKDMSMIERLAVVTVGLIVGVFLGGMIAEIMNLDGAVRDGAILLVGFMGRDLLVFAKENYESVLTSFLKRITGKK